MTEAYAWGQSPQLGYYKHPPLYAWVAGAWFKLLPRTDWAFYLLSQVNAAVGLAGVWSLSGRMLEPKARLAAILLLLAPFHNIMAINFNANSALLSLWPWTAFAFFRAMETGKARHGALFGVLASASMLCKYYSILLLLGCFLAFLASPRVTEILRTRAPWVAAIVCAATLGPHLVWLAAHDWQTIEYAKHTAGHTSDVVWYKTSTTALASLAMLGLPALVAAVAFRWRPWTHLAAVIRGGANRQTAPLLIVTTAPYVLTLATGALGSVKISTNFLIPAFSLVTMTVLALSRAVVTAAQLTTIARAAVLYPLVMIGLAPAIANYQFEHQIDLASDPRKAVAKNVDRMWHDAFQRPLRLVAGSNAYGSGMAFYSKDRPSEFIRLNHAYAPWVTPDRLRQDGIAIVCTDDDGGCIKSAAALMTPEARRASLELAHVHQGERGIERAFEVFLIPPGPIPPAIPFLSQRARSR